MLKARRRLTYVEAKDLVFPILYGAWSTPTQVKSALDFLERIKRDNHDPGDGSCPVEDDERSETLHGET